MIRGIKTFVCDNCGHKFKGLDIEWNATVFSQPLRCPNCGNEDEEQPWPHNEVTRRLGGEETECDEGCADEERDTTDTPLGFEHTPGGDGIADQAAEVPRQASEERPPHQFTRQPNLLHSRQEQGIECKEQTQADEPGK